MLRRTSICALIVPLLALCAVSARTASADETPFRAENLKILPKNIAEEDLDRVMSSFTTALGVGCGFCHEHRDMEGEREWDFAADTKDAKVQARVMMRMVDAINGEWMSKVSIYYTPDPGVTCMTCHRGRTNPDEIEDLLYKTIVAEGIERALDDYRDLRMTYAGTNAYDFTAAPLLRLAARLQQEKKLDAAEAVLRLAVGDHWEEASVHRDLALFLAAGGRIEEARVALDRAKKRAPRARWLARVEKRIAELSGAAAADVP